MNDSLVLAYWGIRGRAQILRHLLAYSGLKWEEKIYTSMEEYSEEKYGLGLDFPNLPYLLDGEVRITQSFAIAKYIIRRSGKVQLQGKTIKDQGTIDNFIYSFWDDIIGPLIIMLGNKKVQDIKTGHYYKNKSRYEKIQKYLTGKKFVLGYLTLADFYVAEGSYYLEKLFPEEYVKFKSMHKIRQIVENLEAVKTYYKRTPHIRTPFLPLHYTATPFHYTQKGTTEKKEEKKEEKEEEKESEKVEQKLPQNITETREQQKPEEVEVNEEQKEQTEAVNEEKNIEEQNFQQMPNFYSPENPLNVVLISGSISANSPVNYFLNALFNFGHPAFSFEWADISSLELHNEDIEEEGTDNANDLRGQIYEADGILIGVSQTNHSVSAALTNAYNWMVAVIQEKPIGLVSIENSEEKMRKILSDGGMSYMEKPYLSVSGEEFFDEEGNIKQSQYSTTANYLNSLAKYMEEYKNK